MEINGKNPLAVQNASVQRLDVQQPAQRVQKAGDGGSTSESDRIELSVRSREIQHIDDLIRSTSDIRAAKVEEIRNAIENGTYNVKAKQIAEKIIGGSLIDEVF